MSSCEEYEDSENENKKIIKKICCKDCGKQFSYHQGLYTHKKSGVCTGGIEGMINTQQYLDEIKIDINEIIEIDNINSVYKHIFKTNNYDKLPFRIYDKKRRLIRILVEDKYKIDNDYKQLQIFLSRIRMIIIRKINKKNMLKSSGDIVCLEMSFLNTMLSDYDHKFILSNILESTS